MATAATTIHDHYIFGDESSRTAHRYLVVGTMDCAGEHVDEIITRLNKAKRNRSEFAWSSSPSRDGEHFVREIFYFISRRKLWFRCAVVNTRHADHKKHSGGDKDLSLEKYIFYHLLMFARREADLTRLTRFYVQLDNRTEKYTGAGQKASLNHRFRNETGHQWEIFAHVEDVDSKAQVMVQAADVLAGCVAWVWNRQFENEKVDPERVAFAKMIAGQAKLRLSDEAKRDGVDLGSYQNFAYPTLPHHEKVQGFTIWKMNFRKEQEDQAKAVLNRMRARYGDEATLNRVSQDYRIGARCFECPRTEPIELSTIAHRTLRVRPRCSKCKRIGYLTFRERRTRSS